MASAKQKHETITKWEIIYFWAIFVWFSVWLIFEIKIINLNVLMLLSLAPMKSHQFT